MRIFQSFIIMLTISSFCFAQTPANDECANRININVNTAAVETLSVDLSLATPSSPQLLTD